MRLFAEQGFSATSVADVQQACGLTPGSGALYKHFPSKYALLAEGLRQYVLGLEQSRTEFMSALPTDPHSALRTIAEAVTTAVAGDGPVIRVVLRDLEPFPELHKSLWDGLVTTLYGGLTTWIAEQHHRGRLPVADPPATAAVLMGSLTYYGVLDALIGRAPGDIGLERFLNAWVETAARTLGVPPREGCDDQRDGTNREPL